MDSSCLLKRKSTAALPTHSDRESQHVHVNGDFTGSQADNTAFQRQVFHLGHSEHNDGMVYEMDTVSLNNREGKTLVVSA